MKPRNESPSVTTHTLVLLHRMTVAHIKRFIARSFFYPVHTVIINVRQIGEDAQRHTEKGISQSPITVIVIPVTFAHYGIVPTFQKVLCRSEPHVDHPLLEAFEILSLPLLVITHQLGRIQKLVTDKAGHQGLVCIPTDSFGNRNVLVQHIDSPFRPLRLACNFPKQGTLVSLGRIAIGVHVVFVTGNSTFDIFRHSPNVVHCLVGHPTVLQHLKSL